MDSLASATRALIALQEVEGIGPATVRRVAAGLGHVDLLAVADAGRLAGLASTLRQRPITPDMVDAALCRADDILARCRAAGIGTLIPGEQTWPFQLNRLADPPLVLYWRGAREALLQPAVAVVGTRTPTPFGRACARRFGLRCVEAGAVVVSGLALGCDGAAHEGALDGHGRTVAVLPGPIDRVIPPSHHLLAERLLAAGGALVSEYPPDPAARVHKHQFIARDRLQAGLSLGVLVVETGLEGGTLHAVHAAQRAHLPIACLASSDPDWSTAPGTAGGRDLVARRVGIPLATAADLGQWLETLGLRPSTPPVPPP